MPSMPRVTLDTVVKLPNKSLSTVRALVVEDRIKGVKETKVVGYAVATRYFAELIGDVWWFWELRPSAYSELRRLLKDRNPNA